MLGRFFNKAVGDAAKKFRTYAGDTVFLNAAVSLAANVILADKVAEPEELKKGKKVILDHRS